MNFLVPFDGSSYTDTALREACRIAAPLDTVIVMAHVHAAIPMHTAWQDEVYYKRRWRAECLLADACTRAARYGLDGAHLKTVQVEAPNRTQAIRAATERWSVARLILALPASWYGQLLFLVHPTVRSLLHAPPCPVQILFVQHRHASQGAVLLARDDSVRVANLPSFSVPTGNDERVSSSHKHT